MNVSSFTCSAIDFHSQDTCAHLLSVLASKKERMYREIKRGITVTISIRDITALAYNIRGKLEVKYEAKLIQQH